MSNASGTIWLAEASPVESDHVAKVDGHSLSSAHKQRIPGVGVCRFHHDWPWRGLLWGFI